LDGREWTTYTVVSCERVIYSAVIISFLTLAFGKRTGRVDRRSSGQEPVRDRPAMISGLFHRCTSLFVSKARRYCRICWSRMVKGKIDVDDNLSDIADVAYVLANSTVTKISRLKRMRVLSPTAKRRSGSGPPIVTTGRTNFMTRCIRAPFSRTSMKTLNRTVEDIRPHSHRDPGPTSSAYSDKCQ
jgi:hypothetical protein